MSRALAVAYALGLMVTCSVQAQPAAVTPAVMADAGARPASTIAIAIKGEGLSSASHGATISGIVTADLEQSGVFSVIAPAAFAGLAGDVGVIPDYAGWTAVKARYLGNGRVLIDGDGRLRTEIRLWNIEARKEMFGQSMAAAPDNERRLAHKVADIVYKAVTGQAGYFDTRIAFVALSGTAEAPLRRLAVMDQDGNGLQFLTDGSAAVSTPRFSADGEEIAYVVAKPDGARILVFNLMTGRQEALGNIKGTLSSPRFAPDGSQLAFSLAADGNADIYVMDLRSRAMKRVTSGAAADTQPSFSPDGGHIVFVSDRSGVAQIYSMKADGSEVVPLTKGGDVYGAPAYSPDGDLIAFVRQSAGRASIGVMHADGSGERLLTVSGKDSGPGWAPDSRHLVFCRETTGKPAALWTTEVTGGRERLLSYGGGAAEPDWSPRSR